MGTTSSALSSSAGAPPTPLTSPITLTSVSSFSSDFQSILNRSVAIANLPVQQLQNEDTNIQTKESQLATLGTAVSNFETSLTALGTLGSTQALSASSSDSSVVSAQATGATTPASYTISNITSVAAAASETSLTGYADGSTAAVSTTGTLTLVVGSKDYTVLSPTSGTNTLAGVAQAINAAGAGVTATVLTTGTGATPNYLSITANNTGASTLQLFDGTATSGTNLLSATNQGSDAIFQLNNLNVDNPNNTINDVISGLTFTIAAKTTSGQTVNLSLASDPTQLQGALQDFVTQYNALSAAATTQVGQGAGLLSGDPIVQAVQDALRQVTAVQGTPGGAIQNLSDLGIELDQTGSMTLNTSTLSALSSSQVTSAFAYLGSTATGLGGLAPQFASLTDPFTGMIEEQQASYVSSDQNLQSQITTLNDRISLMQTNLSAQLEAADALQAELTSQQSELNATITSLNYSAFGGADRHFEHRRLEIMSHLERVLRDLEIATAALGGEDPVERRAKLKRRSEAIARMADVREPILSLGPADFQDVITRLTRAVNAGESVQRELAQLKQNLTVEWGRWNQVHQSLAAGGQRPLKKIDYSG